MARYRVVIFDASAGTPKAELPLTGLTFSRVLSGCGSLSGSMSQWHPAATEDNLGQLRTDPDRFLAVYRDDLCVWAGPLTGTDCTFTGGMVNLVAREMTWYLGKRVLEEDRDYNGWDYFDIIRDLSSYMVGKTGTGTDGVTLGSDILAAIPGWSVMSGLAGTNFTTSLSTTFYGSAKHSILDCMQAIAADPSNPVEWFMDYGTGSTRIEILSQLQLGFPCGSTFAGEITEKVLVDLSRACDWEEAATREHMLGSNYTKTLQSTVAVTNGVILTERVDDAGDLANTDLVDARAKDMLRWAKPASRVFTFTQKPFVSLPYGFAELGDTVPFEVISPNILSVTSNSRRVTQIDTSADDTSENVLYTLNDPLSDAA